MSWRDCERSKPIRTMPVYVSVVENAGGAGIGEIAQRSERRRGDNRYSAGKAEKRFRV